MHRQQTGRFLDGKLAVRTGVHMKVRDARALFVEEITFMGRTWTGRSQGMSFLIVRLIISANYLHMRPPYAPRMSQVSVGG
jgi:hypothetical protein